MSTFTTYYSTGSFRRGTMKHHKRSFASKKAAVAHAKKVSKRTGNFVTVLRKGIEVAACDNGTCSKG